MRVSKWFLTGSIIALVSLIASSCGYKHGKYENPITKDTQQPDKILFDKAINDIEKGRFEMARLTLQTLINTYDSSEYLAKAKLAVGDAWYREGGARGRAQAELEYKDFILFYPTMQEAAESQEKICRIHSEQMDRPDRDPSETLKTEQECRQVLIQFPNSKFAPEAEQITRNAQEVLAEGEFLVGKQYHDRGGFGNVSAANRLSGVADQYPLYSKADEALWLAADSYQKSGPRFRQMEGDAYTRIVRDYPLSPRADAAKAKLKTLEMPIPEADPAAVARMRFEAQNRVTPGLFHRLTNFMRSSPDTYTAAKAGAPQMNAPAKNVPVSVPIPGSAAGFQGDVTVAPADPTGASPAGGNSKQPAPSK